MKNFRDLIVWKKSHQLAIKIFQISKTFPKEELFGITSQIRRATLSIPTNISEGCGRGSDSDFARFIQMALGSASEAEYLLLFCRELGFIQYKEHEIFNNEIIDIKKSLTALLKKLKAER